MDVWQGHILAYTSFPSFISTKSSSAPVLAGVCCTSCFGTPALTLLQGLFWLQIGMRGTREEQQRVSADERLFESV
jgi:hypothetical protein